MSEPIELFAVWMMANGYATGHGDTFEDLLGEFSAQHAERTRPRPTSRELLSALRLDGLPNDHRLIVMCQNPANNHHWSKAVGGFTAGDVRDSLKNPKE